MAEKTESGSASQTRLFLATREDIDNLINLEHYLCGRKNKSEEIRNEIFDEACKTIKEQLQTNKLLIQKIDHVQKEHEIFIGIKYIILWSLLLILALFTLSYMVGGALWLSLEAQKNNWWICEQPTKSTWGQPIAILLLYLGVNGPVLAVLIWTCFAYFKALRREKLEHDLQKKYELKIRKLLTLHKYRERYGDKYIDMIFDKITQLYSE